MNTNTIKKLAAMLGVICGLTFNLHAQDIYWQGTGTGDWFTTTNWDTNSLPTASDDVYINNGGTVIINSGSADCANGIVGTSGSGSLIVTGNGSWHAAEGSYIGWGNYGMAGYGVVTVSGNGYYYSGSTATLTIGGNDDSRGFLNIEGSGSVISARMVENGLYYDYGEINVRDNGYLETGGDTNSFPFFISMGGTGVLNIAGNGYVYANTPMIMMMGYGVLTIVDSGSLVGDGDFMFISPDSTINLTVTGTAPKIMLAGQFMPNASGTLNLDFANSGTLRASEVLATHTVIHTGGGFNSAFDTVTGTSSEDYVTYLNSGINGNDYQAEYDLSWNQELHGNFTVRDNTTFIVDVVLSDTGAVNSLVKNGEGTLIFESVSNYTGDTTINSGTVIFDQTANQTLQGLVSGSGVLVQKGSGTLAFKQSGSYGGTIINNTNFSLGGVDQKINNLVNNGNVYFVNLGKTLTVGNLSGSGDFHMDVNITTGEHDFIKVTGTLSGTHRLNITNQGGDNGNDFNITVAEAANHDNGTFVSDFDIGMFQYELQGTGTRYYITRTTDPTPAPQAGPTGEDLLADLPSQSQSWFDNMNNITAHLGELRSSPRERLSGGILDAVWVKSYGQQVNVSGRVVGAAYREYQYGVDVGADHRWTLDKSNTLIAGAFVGYGSLDRTLRNGLQNDGSTDNYHFGLYGIWLHESGLYADVIAKGQYADHEVNAWDASNNHTTADYNNWGGGVTLDLGKQFKFKDGWFVEPSLSAGYAHFTGESYTAHNTSPFAVTISDADVFQFKLGVQFGRTITLSNGGILQPYIKVAGVEQASTGGKLRASGAEWRPTLDGASAEIGGGVIWQLNTQHSLTLDYEASFGNKYDKPWGLTAGYRYQF